MLTALRNTVFKDRLLLAVLTGGFVVQLITCITAIGVSSADQHFQIVEFSLYQLGKANGAMTLWEIDHFVRPTLQVYLFSGFHVVCNALGLTDPYAQLTFLRILLGLFMFFVFNLIALYYFLHQSRRILLFVLLLLNFSWVLPYTRTMYSSEMVSSVVFFGAMVWYLGKKQRYSRFIFPAVIGLLFSMAFYFRFQIGFALAGFGLWLVFFEKRYQDILPMASGFALGILINVLLDYGFYKEWVFTPYTYFYANINAGRAASFGTSSFLRYIGLILLVMPAPFFSLVLFYYSIKAFFRQYTNPMFLAVIIFIIGHSLVGHKEERFLFPIFNVLPFISGWAIPYLESYYAAARQWIKKFLKGLIVFSVVLNCILLVAITSIPYSQTVLFSYRLKKELHGKPVVLYCLGQTPYETPGSSQMVFYKMGAPNIAVKELDSINAIRSLPEGAYLSANYKEAGYNAALLDSLGFRPVVCSSPLLWKLNEQLRQRKINTINEIWMLYQKHGN